MIPLSASGNFRTIGALVLSVFAAFGVYGGDVHVGGLVVLDNGAETFSADSPPDDGLTLVRADGEVGFRASGLNNMETIASSHQLAVDRTRGWLWVLETAGRKVHKFNQKGEKLATVENLRGRALAVDEETGNVWVLTTEGSIGSGDLVVLDPEAGRLAKHDVSGTDIAYDAKAKALWVVGQSLIKVDTATGQPALQKKIAVWTAVSVAVDAARERVWVAVRAHPNLAESREELRCFDSAGEEVRSIDLGDKALYKVSVDAETGSVWASVAGKAVQRYSTEGALEMEQEIEALSADVDPVSHDLWVVTPEHLVRITPTGERVQSVDQARRTTQAWSVWF